MKNILLKYCVELVRFFVPKHARRNRILVVTTTALGDTLWGTAAIESIRKAFPDCYLGVLTSTIGIQVLKGNPYIDKLFLLKEPLSRYFFSLWKELYEEKFDTVLLFHASQRLTLPLCALLGAKKIVGTAGINKGLDCLLTHPLPNKAQHEIVRRLKIAEAIGAAPTTEKLSIFIDESSQTRQAGVWVALHPGSKDAFKRWPKNKFIELGRRLKKEMACELLITGTKEERALMEEIASEIPGAHMDLPNRSLREFASLLSQMDLIISNDTGPVHLASALGKPVVAIYASTDPFLCGPHKAEKAVVISRRPTCDPCLKRKCHLPFCFLQIGVDEVFQTAASVLQKSGLGQKLDAAEKT